MAGDFPLISWSLSKEFGFNTRLKSRRLIINFKSEPPTELQILYIYTHTKWKKWRSAFHSKKVTINNEQRVGIPFTKSKQWCPVLITAMKLVTIVKIHSLAEGWRTEKFPVTVSEPHGGGYNWKTLKQSKKTNLVGARLVKLVGVLSALDLRRNSAHLGAIICRCRIHITIATSQLHLCCE